MTDCLELWSRALAICRLSLAKLSSCPIGQGFPDRARALTGDGIGCLPGAGHHRRVATSALDGDVGVDGEHRRGRERRRVRKESLRLRRQRVRPGAQLDQVGVLAKGTDLDAFSRADLGVVVARIDPATGLRPAPGSEGIEEFFLDGTAPTESAAGPRRRSHPGSEAARGTRR